MIVFHYRCCHGDPCNAIICGPGDEFNRASYCMLLLLLCFITGVVMVTHAMLSHVDQEVSSTERHTVSGFYYYVSLQVLSW